MKLDRDALRVARALRWGPATGYMIGQRDLVVRGHSPFSIRHALGFGTIYWKLDRLMKRGLVVEYGVLPTFWPMESAVQWRKGARQDRMFYALVRDVHGAL